MAETNETKPKAPAKRKPKAANVDENQRSILDALNADVGVLRQQLRLSEPVALPETIVRLLPESPSKGERRKVLEWRSFVVWAEWTGAEWRIDVFVAGKKRA